MSLKIMHVKSIVKLFIMDSDSFTVAGLLRSNLYRRSPLFAAFVAERAGGESENNY